MLKEIGILMFLSGTEEPERRVLAKMAVIVHGFFHLLFLTLKMELRNMISTSGYPADFQLYYCAATFNVIVLEPSSVTATSQS